MVNVPALLVTGTQKNKFDPGLTFLDLNFNNLGLTQLLQLFNRLTVKVAI